jgi:ATP-dependent DNA ligase
MRSRVPRPVSKKPQRIHDEKGYYDQAAPPPKWIKPELTRLVEEAPGGADWLHEIKYDGYRVHARIDGDKIQLLTRTGLDWSDRYRSTIKALRSLKVKSAYLDGELCALNADGVPMFSRLQAAMDEGRTDQLVFFAFDLLFFNGQGTAQLPLIERKERLKRLFKKESQGLRYSDALSCLLPPQSPVYGRKDLSAKRAVRRSIGRRASAARQPPAPSRPHRRFQCPGIASRRQHDLRGAARSRS